MWSEGEGKERGLRGRVGKDKFRRKCREGEGIEIIYKVGCGGDWKDKGKRKYKEKKGMERR